MEGNRKKSKGMERRREEWKGEERRRKGLWITWWMEF